MTWTIPQNDLAAKTLLKEVLSKYVGDVFVETGTYYGNGVALALECGFKRIISIEINPNKVAYNKERFAKEIDEKRVEIIEGDTALLFPGIIGKIDETEKAVFWLDAHWDGYGPQGIEVCPLIRELRAIARHPNKNHTILVDDRRLFGVESHGWGKTVTEQEVVAEIMKINSKYKICYENGHVIDDIIAASTTQ
jgi:hypothetical protein